MSARSNAPLGDALASLAMLLWLSVTVGPWWLGLGIFVGAWVANYAQAMRQGGER